jgi:hypothetical protein
MMKKAPAPPLDLAVISFVFGRNPRVGSNDFWFYPFSLASQTPQHAKEFSLSLNIGYIIVSIEP